MASSGMLRRVALVRTDVSEELSASIIRVTRIGELGTTLARTSNRRTLQRNTNVIPSSPILITLMMEALSSAETSVLTRATRRSIPEDAILKKESIHLIGFRTLDFPVCSYRASMLAFTTEAKMISIVLVWLVAGRLSQTVLLEILC
jgi:hypothetical protein